MERKRSKGVTIIGWLHLVYACIGFAIYGFGFLLMCLTTLMRLFGNSERAIHDIWSRALSPRYIFALVVLAVTFFIGKGLLSLRNFTRVLLIWIHVSFIARFVLVLCMTIFVWDSFPTNISKVTLTASTLISIVIIYYLTRSKVKEQFK